MLNSERVTSTDSAHFPAIDALYGRAFPWHEQREAKAKQQALDNPHYELEAWFDDGQFIGLSGCWRFADYRYVEHLAIDDTLRSRGYGKRLLAEILQRAPLARSRFCSPDKAPQAPPPGSRAQCHRRFSPGSRCA